MKICKDCKKEKEQSDFYGIQGECKKCTQKRVTRNYYNNIDYYQKYEKERNKRFDRKIKKLEYQKKRRKLHGDKVVANRAVSNAIRSGKLHRFPCIICGDTKSQAHHTDYRKKLEVKWLCQKHHTIEHNNARKCKKC